MTVTNPNMPNKYRPRQVVLSATTFIALTGLATMALSQAAAPPESQQQRQYAANDLVPSLNADLSAPSFKSLSSSLQNQINDKPQYQQQQQHQYNHQYNHHHQQRAFKSGPRTVINGNHATYVEPPADFKPIIYESQAARTNTNVNQVQSAESLSESPNHLVPSVLAPMSSQNSRQQQKRQTQTAAAAAVQQQQQLQPQPQPQPQPQLVVGNQITGTFERTNQQRPAAANQQPTVGLLEADNAAANDDIDLVDDESNSIPMKPSIDRWSDWYDMSVDPDLASSDSQLLSITSSAGSLPPAAQSGPHQQPPIKSESESQLSDGAMGAPSSLMQFGKSAVGAARLPWYQAKLDLNMIGEPAAIQEDDARQRSWRVLPLNHQASNLIKMRQIHEQPAAFELKQDQQYPAQPRYFIQQQQQQQLHAAEDEQRQQQLSMPYHQQAFYYILPAQIATTHSSFQMQVDAAPQPPMMMLQQQQQPQQLPMLPSQPWKKFQTFNIFKANQLQQQRPAFSMIGSLKSHARKSKAATASTNAEVVKLVPSQKSERQKANAPLVMLQKQGTTQEIGQLGKRVSGAVPQATSRVFMPQANAIALNQQRSRPTQANSTTINQQPKRVLRRRRIKTLLPVGLSSWFLGGIRDLDARHWRLPSEVISKLAVNDVDLQHGDQSASVGSDESGAAINMSNQVQPGGSLERPDQPRPSGTTRSPTAAGIGQKMSPRR